MTQRQVPFPFFSPCVFLCLIPLCVFFCLKDAHASGAVAKIQQMKNGKGPVKVQGPPVNIQGIRIQATQKIRVQAPQGIRVNVTPPQGLRLNLKVNAVDVRDIVRDIVSLDEVMASLQASSRVWSLMIDREAKEAVVEQWIKKYRRQGVVINKTSAHYARVIDMMSQESPEMLVQPFEQVFRIVSILEYDFDDGRDKDGLALRVLGTRQAVTQNKERLGIR